MNCWHFWRKQTSKMFLGEITRNRIFIKALVQGKTITEKWLAVQWKILDPFTRKLCNQSILKTLDNRSDFRLWNATFWAFFGAAIVFGLCYLMMFSTNLLSKLAFKKEDQITVGTKWIIDRCDCWHMLFSAKIIFTRGNFGG